VTLRRGTILIAAEERPELNYYSNGDTLTRGGLVGSIPEWLLHGNLAATTIWPRREETDAFADSGRCGNVCIRDERPAEIGSKAVNRTGATQTL